MTTTPVPTQAKAAVPQSPEEQARLKQTKDVLAAISTPPALQPKPATPVPAPAAPRPASLVTQVGAAVARVSPMVSKLAARTRSTFDINSPWARVLIHGEIDSLKTTVAHHFGSPEQCRTILTRGEDQMAPVVNEGYEFLQVNDGDEFAEALSHCDAIWPDWAKHPEPVLIVDDMTRAKDFVVTSSKSYQKADGSIVEYKDTRKVYGEALARFDSIFTIANRKPMHIILVSTSKVVEGKISLEETVMPDLSQGIGNFIMSDYSYIFFLDKKRPPASRMLTSMSSEAVTEYDEAQKKTVTYQRYYFARNKIPAELVGKGIIKQYEPADLRAVWEKVKAAKAQRKAEIAK